jgi:starch phosphorylase
MNSTLHRTQHNLEKVAVYQAVAFSLRDKVLKQWNQTQQLYKKEYRRKRCYYLSMEFLLVMNKENPLCMSS